MGLNLLKHKFLSILILLLAVSLPALFFIDFSGSQKPAWGVTFSRSYALDLQLDWRQTYLAILDELKVDHIRLSAYWDEVEPEKNQYNFTDLDWQIQQAADRQVKIILVIGRRLPRWPECHDPSWLKHYPSQQANQKVLALLETVINRYKAVPAISVWQVENEPLFAWFGFCPPPDEKFLKQEVALVKSLDPTRPILVTDSGELNNWQAAASVADIFGTTMYRVVWSKYTGFFSYWFVPPAFYHYKATLTQFFHPNVRQVIISELQMEPWTMNKNMTELTLEQQQKSFDLKRFQSNIKYAQRTGFTEVYLWGAEYWYWLKQQGHPQIWQAARQLWR